MDAHRFDALTRLLTVTGSRRTALAAIVGGALTRLGDEDAGAHDARRRCKQITDEAKRKTCLKRAKRHNAQHADQCRGRDVCTQGNDAACGPPGNECYCWVTEAGGRVCGGNEGAFPTANCDECARAGRVCVRGDGTQCPGPFVCVLPCCPAGTRECGGRCVDVLRDPDNCGGCGQACGIDRPNVCAGGSCCINAGGDAPCRCAPSGSACAPVGEACCSAGSCTNGVCP